jgi:hypothetical protein
MPGYAHPIETTTSSSEGTSKGLTFSVDDITSPAAFYTATTKTKVSSVLATNNYGTILPVKLYVNRVGTDPMRLIAESRVLKTKYMVQELVSGDSRVGDSGDQQLDKYKVISDFVLEVGDSLHATCPIEDAISLTVNLKEGI